jgi:hypothetical protein
VGLLILTDSAEQRQVAVPCDRRTLDEFSIRMSPETETDRLLPEALLNIVQWQTGVSLEIIIDSIVDGVYHAFFNNKDNFNLVPVRVADAILLSYISHDTIPIFMDEKLYRQQSSVYDDESTGVPLPVNTISDEMLKKALDKAINEENYEMASHLRDELARRRKSSGKDLGQASPDTEE